MNIKAKWAALIVALLLVVVGFVATTVRADAVKNAPCVDTSEYKGSSPYYETRHTLETNWGVQGEGMKVWSPVPNHTNVAYPRCGFVKEFPKVFYGVQYVKTNRGRLGVMFFWTNKYGVPDFYITCMTQQC